MLVVLMEILVICCLYVLWETFGWGLIIIGSILYIYYKLSKEISKTREATSNCEEFYDEPDYYYDRDDD